MNKIIIIFSLVLITAIGASLYVNKNSPDTQVRTLINTLDPVPVVKQNNFTASFEIYTNGTKRIFTAAMYHNLSPDVFIQANEPNIVHVTKESVTWGDFFETLPMKLTKECLITGTKQTFCNTQDKRLSFFINGNLVPNVLEQEIKPGDNLRVLYEDRTN